MQPTLVKYLRLHPLKWFRTPVFRFALLAATGIVFTFSAGAQRISSLDTANSVEEKLVELALNGPLVKAADHQNRVNELQLQRAKNVWMNLLAVSLQYNDQSFNKPGTVPGQYIYPKYFFGLNIPLGTILSRTDVKSARESIEISRNNQEQLKRTIRAEVLSLYRQYQAQGELINLQNELISDMNVELGQVEEKFGKGTITIEVYNAAQKAKNDETGKLINLRLQQELIKLEIEKMIGTSLESVTRR
jgi:outer membrane protein TolC